MNNLSWFGPEIDELRAFPPEQLGCMVKQSKEPVKFPFATRFDVLIFRTPLPGEVIARIGYDSDRLAPATRFALWQHEAEHLANAFGLDGQHSDLIHQAFRAYFFEPQLEEALRTDQPWRPSTPERDKFEPVDFAEIANHDPQEFYIYTVNVPYVQWRDLEFKREFRIIPKDDRLQRIFAQEVPSNLSEGMEEAYWATRHIAQLRGKKRPIMSRETRRQWRDAFFSALTGKTETEMRFDSASSDWCDRTDLVLIAGKEDSMGRASRYYFPRRNLSESQFLVFNSEVRFYGTSIGGYRDEQVVVRLFCSSSLLARRILEEICLGWIWRVGLSKEIHGILVEQIEPSPRLLLAGFSEKQEKDLMAAVVPKWNSELFLYREGTCLAVSPR